MLRGDLDGLLNGLAFEDIEADDHFLALREGVVGASFLPLRMGTFLALATGFSRSPVTCPPGGVELNQASTSSCALSGPGLEVGLGLAADEHQAAQGFSFAANPEDEARAAKPTFCAG
jgi:hypothetical protein